MLVIVQSGSLIVQFFHSIVQKIDTILHKFNPIEHAPSQNSNFVPYSMNSIKEVKVEDVFFSFFLVQI